MMNTRIPASPDNTIVLLSSALFADEEGRHVPVPVSFRLERVRQSLGEFKGYGFSRFVLLDNTVPAAWDLTEALAEDVLVLGGTPDAARIADFVPHPDEFRQYGPSRLEAALLYQMLPQLQTVVADAAYVLKVSAGYRIRNFQQVFTVARQGGAVFRMGNPLRRRIPFCLTSFYLLPVQQFLELCPFFYARIAEMTHLQPLEYYMYRFVQSRRHERVRIAYPKLRARFLAAGKSADDPDYRLKELVFDGLSRMGYYAYRLA